MHLVQSFSLCAAVLVTAPLTILHASDGRSAGMENALRGGAWTFHAAGEREPCAGARSDCQFVDNLPPGLVGRSLVDAEGLSVSEPQAFKDVVASIPSQFEGGKAVLSVSSTLIPHLSSVSVTFQLQGKVPSKNNWVGVYCVDAHPSSVSDDEYMDWKWTNGKRRGTVTFAKLTNMRCAWQFRFFTSIIGKYVKIGESSLVHFINGPTEPLHVHVAATEQPDAIRVHWTSSAVSAPQVWYGTDAQSLTKTARGSGTTYRASDMCHEPATKEGAQWFRDPGVMYNAFMTGLDPAKTYFYRVGNASGVQSPVFMLKTPPAAGRQNGTASFFVYGDLGDWNIKATGDAPAGRTATTIDLVRQDMNDPHTNYVAIMHDGDISYGMGRTYLWDQFGTLIQPVSTEIPYMVAVGNHEYCHTSGGEKDPSGAPGNGFHPDGGNYGGESQGECGVPFDKRFIMPNNGNRAFWWSVEMGLVHHTVISSEHDFTTGSTMFKWLEQDLQSVDRKKTPWLLLHLHRPMYCSEDYPSDYAVSLMIRKHLEPLLGKYRVDVVFSGHYHAYERTCPVYNEQCRSAPLANGLEQAQAPVHFMVGSGGADVDNTTYYNVPWRAAAMMEYGYGRVHVLNATHAKLEFKRNRDNSIPDSAWVISDHAWSV